jgi:hypothetical protein
MSYFQNLFSNKSPSNPEEPSKTSESDKIDSLDNNRKKRDRNSVSVDNSPELVTKKQKDLQLTPEDVNKSVKSNTLVEISCSNMGDTDSDESANHNENMEEMVERLLRKYDRRSSKRLKDELGTVKADLAKIQQDLKPVQEIAKKVSYLEAQVTELRSNAVNHEREERRNNLIVHGLTEVNNESFRDRHSAIQELAKKVNLKEIDYSESRRLGGYAAKKPRPLMVKFIRYRDKAEILANWKLLNGTGISVSDDLSKEERKARAILNNKRKEIMLKDKKAVCRIRNGTLFSKTDEGENRYKVDKMTGLLEEQRQRIQGEHLDQ